MELAKPQLLVLLWSDDPDLIDLVTAFLVPPRYLVEVCHDSQRSRLADLWSLPRCLLVDLRCVGLLKALALQRHVLGQEAPMIVVAGDIDLDAIAKLLQGGTVDVLKHPVRSDMLMAAVKRAEPRARRMHDERIEGERSRLLFEKLTPREQQVCLELSHGRLNKQVAARLQISEKTVKFHRAQVMRKLEIESMPQLARLVDRLPLALASVTRTNEEPVE